jgi:hypothetical protein
VCNKRTRSTGRGDNELVRLCAQCYDEAGVENEHQDGGHEPGSLPEECPMCRQAQANADFNAQLATWMCGMCSTDPIPGELDKCPKCGSTRTNYGISREEADRHKREAEDIRRSILRVIEVEAAVKTGCIHYGPDQVRTDGGCCTRCICECPVDVALLVLRKLRTTMN